MVPRQQPLNPCRIDRNNPIGSRVISYFCPCNSFTDIANGSALERSGVSIATFKGNRVFTFSSGSLISKISPSLTPPFVLAAQFTAPSFSSTYRLLHVTKSVDPLESVTGFYNTGANAGIVGQHYNGTNYLTVPATSSANKMCTVVMGCFASTVDIRLYIDGVTKEVASSSEFAWASGVDIMTFGKANWSTEYFAGNLEWAGLFRDHGLWSTGLEKSLVYDPYQFLIPA
jgi:hypothetical protein